MEGQLLGIWERTQPLVGEDGVAALRSCSVLVVGVGGVGGYAVEALARAGVGKLTLADHDVVSVSNRNRQIIALCSTLGASKVGVFAERIADINPQCAVTTIDAFLTEDDVPRLLDEGPFDYVVDAVDTVSTKIRLLQEAAQRDIPCVSSMGAGGRLDPSQLRLGDLHDTERCPLAKRCRTELRQRGVPRGRVVACYSTEIAQKALAPVPSLTGGRARAVNGTISYIPSLYGLMLAGAVVHHRTRGSFPLTPVAQPQQTAAKHAPPAKQQQQQQQSGDGAAAGPQQQQPPARVRKHQSPPQASVGAPVVVTDRGSEYFRRKGMIEQLLEDGAELQVRLENGGRGASGEPVRLPASSLRVLAEGAQGKAAARAAARGKQQQGEGPGSPRSPAADAAAGGS